MEITLTGLISTLLTGGILLVGVMAFLLTIFNSILETKLDKKTKELSKNQQNLSKDVAEIKAEQSNIKKEIRAESKKTDEKLNKIVDLIKVLREVVDISYTIASHPDKDLIKKKIKEMTSDFKKKVR